MQKNLRWILTLFLLLALPMLACQTLAGTDESEPEVSATQSPEDASTDSGPTDSGSGDTETNGGQSDGAPESVDVNGIVSKVADLTSYRMTMAIELVEEGSDGTTKTTTITTESTSVTNPPANSVNMTIEGDIPELAGMGSILFVQIEDTIYSVLPGMGCVSGAAGEQGFENPFSDLADTSTFLDGVTGATRVLPNETINGVETIHYTFEQSSLPSDSGLQSVGGDLYVAVEGGYMVRLILDGSGQLSALTDSPEGGTGTVHLQMDLSDVNQPLTVEPPEGCDATDSAYPMLDGATNLISMAGFTNYQVSGVSVADAAAFYQTEMVAAGYTADEDSTFITDTSAILSFAKDGKNVTVTISEDAASGGLNVLITEL